MQGKREDEPKEKTDWTVSELYQAELPTLNWVVPELLPAGLASLAGRPKMGKSLLALQLAAAVASGGVFLGHEVEAGRVLYLALEDSPQRLQERMRRLQVTESAPIRLCTQWPELDRPQGVMELVRCVHKTKPLLVVIDTLSRALHAETAYQSDLVSTIMSGLHRLAHNRGCCVLTVDHHRKSGQGRDVVNDLLGHASKAAALDTVWGLYSGREGHGVSLSVTGREVTPCELALEFDPNSGMWQLQPEPEGAPMDGTMSDVARVLAELGGVATTSEMASALGKPAGNVSHALARLLHDGQVRRLPRVGHRVPYELVRRV